MSVALLPQMPSRAPLGVISVVHLATHEAPEAAWYVSHVNPHPLAVQLGMPCAGATHWAASVHCAASGGTVGPPSPASTPPSPSASVSSAASTDELPLPSPPSSPAVASTRASRPPLSAGTTVSTRSSIEHDAAHDS